jgi:putative oxidoreductase
MKYIPAIASGLLGLLFVASGLVVLLNFAPAPELKDGTAAAHFMAAFGPTGYLKFVKVLEVIGGILLAIPKTRNLGLLLLGPIVVNILAYHAFIMKGEGLANPVIIIIALLSLFLLWCERKAFRGLIH